MQTIVRNTCRTSGGAPDERAFEITTTPNQTQKRALELIAQIKPVTERGAKISAGFIGETRLFLEIKSAWHGCRAGMPSSAELFAFLAFSPYGACVDSYQS